MRAASARSDTWAGRQALAAGGGTAALVLWIFGPPWSNPRRLASRKIGQAYACLFGEREDAIMSAAATRLARVLDGSEDVPDAPQQDVPIDEMSEAAPAGFCVDCKDQRAKVHCAQCDDCFCRVCFEMLHRKGKRASHTAQKLPAAITNALSSASAGTSGEMDIEEDDEPLANVAPAAGSPAGIWFTERAKYIPMRLTMPERKILRLLEAALSVSTYTDKIDSGALKKAKRTHAQLQELCSMLSALAVADDYADGKELVEGRTFKQKEAFFQAVFEIGRRHKVMNPEKMRGEYGKLIYMLQDSVTPEVSQLMDMSCVGPLNTVYRFLSERGAEAVLQDDLVSTATREIIADGAKARVTLNRESKEKHRAIESLGDKYASRRITEDEIKLCLYSIGDNHSYLTANRDPVDKMIEYLAALFSPEQPDPGYDLSISGEEYLAALFPPEQPDPGYDLSISGGDGGARLSHSHEKQYGYVLQSLSLWREIAHDMFRLWCLSEEDLLASDTRYELRDTGQGQQRVQASPKVSRAMRNVLHATQQKVGHWIGSSVVHLGDNNVPNALVFIDKYTQVSCILNPIIIVIKQIPELCKNAQIAEYIDSTFGGPDTLRKDILYDFFKSAFDGSGADNFYDAGSCIDGRLTSAWHWCSSISEKPFYPIFKLAGFASFDGEFQR